MPPPSPPRRPRGAGAARPAASGPGPPMACAVAGAPPTARRSGRSPPATPACSRPCRSRTPHTPAGRSPAPGLRAPARPRPLAARPATPRPSRAAWPPGTRGGQHPRLFTSTYDARRLFLIAPRPGSVSPRLGNPGFRASSVLYPGHRRQLGNRRRQFGPDPGICGIQPVIEDDQPPDTAPPGRRRATTRVPAPPVSEARWSTTLT